MTTEGWIGVDLDGVLAYYDEWRGVDHVGEPIPAMVDRVRRWIAEGKRVKVFTARVDNTAIDANEARAAIERWLEKQGLAGLEITNVKDYGMVELWDDRCVQMEPNTGRPALEALLGQNVRLLRALVQPGDGGEA